MKLMELFCGTKSMANTFLEKGHSIYTLDDDSRFSPDTCINILDFTINMLPDEFKNPDIVWASPPCQCFSVASISTHWTGGVGAYIPKTDSAKNAIKLVQKTVDLINELNPTFWFIENPRGVLRKLDVVKGLSRKTVTYCQYGDERMKPTDIWTNCEFWEPRPMCKNGAPCHERAPRGAKTGTQGLKGSIERSRIPKELCEEILKACIKK